MTRAGPNEKKEGKKTTECRYRCIVDESKCIGCSICVDSCPNDVLELVDGCPFASQPDRCEGCEVCVVLCEQEAIEIEEQENDETPSHDS